jgi:hypothetical protein
LIWLKRSLTRVFFSKENSMRNIILLAFAAAAGLTGCATYNEAEHIARLNADYRVWPPVVAGQPFPVQTMSDKN